MANLFRRNIPNEAWHPFGAPSISAKTLIREVLKTLMTGTWVCFKVAILRGLDSPRNQMFTLYILLTDSVYYYIFTQFSSGLVGTFSTIFEYRGNIHPSHSNFAILLHVLLVTGSIWYSICSSMVANIHDNTTLLRGDGEEKSTGRTSSGW